jgi:uncharacterized membrane protein
MKHIIHHRLVAAYFTSSMLLSLPGCERALEVVDQIDDGAPGTEQPGTGSATPTTPSPPVQNAACACAGSESLRALICGGGEVPLLGNDIVQTTADGGVVVFSRCKEDFFECDVLRWDGAATEEVAKGFLVGIDASGERVLASDGTATLVDVGGATRELSIDPLQGRDLLTASGEYVFGAVYSIERRTSIVRSNESGELEPVGDVSGTVAIANANPAGTALVGWALGDEGEGEDAAFTYQPFRWDADGFHTDFPGVPDGVTVWPESVSDDGTILVGRSLPDQTHFMWSEAGGYVELASASWVSETFISADGSVVLGSLDTGGATDASDLSGTRAFRWTEASGAVELTPGTPSVALDMSEDGSVIAAYSWEPALVDGAAPEATFVWDTEHGTRTLEEVLAQRGVDTSGWEFGTPRALSGDGRVLLGLASCGGVETLYRAVLSD